MNHRQQKLKALARTVQLRGLASATAGAAPAIAAAASPAAAKPVATPIAVPQAAAAPAAAGRVLTAKEYAEEQGVTPSTARTRLEKLVAQGEASRADAVRNGVRCVEYTLR
ncbi:hypothetical protein [Chitinilyticum litopenaei]|uniref:hypothetical protein n=1 Tax=Chitinilyticum litopenaei TaxID=1121276 RepID=UPI0004217B4D|nr:hypothetical protein [Chitinilyticum litopenaei]